MADCAFSEKSRRLAWWVQQPVCGPEGPVSAQHSLQGAHEGLGAVESSIYNTGRAQPGAAPSTRRPGLPRLLEPGG